MRLFNRIAVTVSVLGYTLITSIPALAASQQTLLAQTGGVAGECRQTNQDISIYENRSSESEEVVNLQQHEQVFLGEDSTIGGWIAVDWPTEGYVNAQYLTACETFDPTVPTPFCFHDSLDDDQRFAIYKENRSTIEDWVYNGDHVHTLDEPELGEDQMRWLEIIHPIEGWVQYGSLASETTNFFPCNVPED